MNIKNALFILTVVLLSAIPFRGVAQMETCFSANGQLSSSLVNQVHQDSKGFIWIATESGLNKFDGTHFTHYKHIDGDSTSLIHDHVRSVMEDSHQNLWVKGRGLMLYHPETESFELIKMQGEKDLVYVANITELRNGEVWGVTAGSSIFRIDLSRKIMQPIDAINQKLRQLIPNISILFLFEDVHRCIWILTENSVFICYNPETEELTLFHSPAVGDRTQDIAEDSNGNLFVGMQDRGLLLFDRTERKFTSIPYGNKQHLPIKDLAFVEGRLLIGTDGEGIKTFNPVTRQIEDYPVNTRTFDLSKAKVHSILQDRDKNLWISIFQKGVILLSAQRNHFGYIGHKQIHNNPIGTGCIMSILKDTEGHLWIGADSEGVFELDTDNKLIKHHSPGNTSTCIPRTVMSIFQDSNHNLWLGAYSEGLAMLDRRTGKCSYIPHFTHKSVTNITEDLQQNLYISTLGDGLYIYNPHTKALQHHKAPNKSTVDTHSDILCNNWVNALLRDSNGLIWIAHYQGISCYDPDKNSFINMNQTNLVIPGGIGYSFLKIKKEISGQACQTDSTV